MNYSSASGLSVHATVNLIMAAKPLDVIVGQPTMAFMDKMMEQMAQMVAPVKTTAWGGLHGSLALILDNADYKIITKAVVKSTTRLGQPALVNPKINNTTSQLDLLTLQAKTSSKRSLTCNRPSPPSAYNASSTALRSNTLKNSRKNILATQIRPSRPSLIISTQTGARS
jgi:hypothetical protein